MFSQKKLTQGEKMGTKGRSDRSGGKAQAKNQQVREDNKTRHQLGQLPTSVQNTKNGSIR
jgi:hypothetical protein